jgi:hypothetical protein
MPRHTELISDEGGAIYPRERRGNNLDVVLEHFASLQLSTMESGSLAEF